VRWRYIKLFDSPAPSLGFYTKTRVKPLPLFMAKPRVAGEDLLAKIFLKSLPCPLSSERKRTTLGMKKESIHFKFSQDAPGFNQDVPNPFFLRNFSYDDGHFHDHSHGFLKTFSSILDTVNRFYLSKQSPRRLVFWVLFNSSLPFSSSIDNDLFIMVLEVRSQLNALICYW